MTEQKSDNQQLVPQSQVPNDWYALIDLVSDSVTSRHSKRAYSRALIDFLDWYEENDRPGFSKATVNAYRSYMLEEGKSRSSINPALSAIRKLAAEAADNELMPPTLAAASSGYGASSRKGYAPATGSPGVNLQTCMEKTAPS